MSAPLPHCMRSAHVHFLCVCSLLARLLYLSIHWLQTISLLSCCPGLLLEELGGHHIRQPYNATRHAWQHSPSPSFRGPTGPRTVRRQPETAACPAGKTRPRRDNRRFSDKATAGAGAGWNEAQAVTATAIPAPRCTDPAMTSLGCDGTTMEHRAPSVLPDQLLLSFCSAFAQLLPCISFEI